MKLNNETIRTAVSEWLENSKVAEEKYGHISNWDVSNVTNMSDLFAFEDSFNENIGRWDVSNVEYMTGMFCEAESFNQNISSWNVANVKFMIKMFEGAKSFNQDISSWNVSNVTKMSMMFNDAQSFNQNLDNWNVENVTDLIKCETFESQSESNHNKCIEETIKKWIKKFNKTEDLTVYSSLKTNLRDNILKLLNFIKTDSFVIYMEYIGSNKEIDEISLENNNLNPELEKISDDLLHLIYEFFEPGSYLHTSDGSGILEYKNEKLTFKLEDRTHNRIFNPNDFEKEYESISKEWEIKSDVIIEIK